MIASLRKFPIIKTFVFSNNKNAILNKIKSPKMHSNLLFSSVLKNIETC